MVEDVISESATLSAQLRRLRGVSVVLPRPPPSVATSSVSSVWRRSAAGVQIVPPWSQYGGGDRVWMVGWGRG